MIPTCGPYTSLDSFCRSLPKVNNYMYIHLSAICHPPPINPYVKDVRKPASFTYPTYLPTYVLTHLESSVYWLLEPYTSYAFGYGDFDF